MEQEHFSIILESQLGQRAGSLTLDYIGNEVRGILELLGNANPVTGKRQGETECFLQHHLRTTISNLECRTILRRTEDGIRGSVTTQFGSMALRGTLSPVKMQENKP